MKKFKAHQLEFDEIINTTTSNEFAKKITMVSSTDASNAAVNEHRGSDGGVELGARLQGGNDGAEEARDAAENNGDNRNNDSRGNNSNNNEGDGNDNGGDNRNEGETTATYIYQDFAQTADNDDDQDDNEDVNDVTAGNKQSSNQKLPKKLAAMLCDPGKRSLWYIVCSMCGSDLYSSFCYLLRCILVLTQTPFPKNNSTLLSLCRLGNLHNMDATRPVMENLKS